MTLGETLPGHYFFVQTDQKHRDNVSVLLCSPRKHKTDPAKNNRALYEFVNARPPLQQGIIRHLGIRADWRWYIKCNKDSCPEFRDFSLHASQVPSITQKLQDLRTLDITIDYPNDAGGIEYYACSIHQLLRSVKVSEAVTLTMGFCKWRSHHPYRTVRWEWDSHF